MPHEILRRLYAHRCLLRVIVRIVFYFHQPAQDDALKKRAISEVSPPVFRKTFLVVIRLSVTEIHTLSTNRCLKCFRVLGCIS